MSALQFLRDIAVGATTKVWYKIRGGNDQLPKAFAAALAARIHYGAPVVRIEQDASSVRAIYLHAGTPATVSGEYMVCTIPLASDAPCRGGARVVAVEARRYRRS
jgi:monoamine oxidase